MDTMAQCDDVEQSWLVLRRFPEGEDTTLGEMIHQFSVESFKGGDTRCLKRKIEKAICQSFHVSEESVPQVFSNLVTDMCI